MMQDQPEDIIDDAAVATAASLDKDRLLPIANVARLMKRALPENAKIAKDAKDCLQECVSEFISFVTSEASDRCAVEKRKTIGGEDILWALTSLGFDNYSDTLKTYLTKYREQSVKGDRPPRDDVASTVATLQAFEQHQFQQQQQQQQQYQDEYED
ncbi:nuclear transcription factor Y subunit B4 [Obelidium mucronatum]|nr:nuclear transcription factor Y subunit B4 [Obelidium mucronatum]